MFELKENELMEIDGGNIFQYAGNLVGEGLYYLCKGEAEADEMDHCINY